jgi:hypothetical protein
MIDKLKRRRIACGLLIAGRGTRSLDARIGQPIPTASTVETDEVG